MRAQVQPHVEIEAVAYPKCVCGLPWAKHAPNGCPGYRPDGVIRDHGTVAFQSPRLLPSLLWRVECAVKALRRKVS